MVSTIAQPSADEHADGFPHTFASGDVETGGRFVEEQNLRAAGDRQRELHAPLLTAGKFAVAALHDVVDAGERDDVGERARIGIVAAE